VSLQTAADELHEDQLLNFIINLLTGAVRLDLGDNAEIEPEDLWEVLVGACVDGTSI
jgi:hypothetical protein